MRGRHLEVGSHPHLAVKGGKKPYLAVEGVEATLTWVSLECRVMSRNQIVRLGVVWASLLVVRSMIVHLETAGSTAKVWEFVIQQLATLPTSRQ
jgi:hypothetical protein